MNLRALSGPNLGLGQAGGAAATGLYLLFIGLPVLALAVRAAQQESFLASVTSQQAQQALRLSLITSGVSMVVGIPFAHLLARSNSPLLRGVDVLVELPIVLLPVVGGFAMLMAFGRRGLIGSTLEDLGITLPFTTTAVIFSQIFVAAPLYIRAARLGFQSVAREYEDVSQTLGVSPWRTFWRLTLPLAGPSIITGLALAWARAISEFGATLMFAGNLVGKTQTMPLAIMTALESSQDTALALAVLLPVGSVLVLAALGMLSRRQWQGRA